MKSSVVRKSPSGSVVRACGTKGSRKELVTRRVCASKAWSLPRADASTSRLTWLGLGLGLGLGLRLALGLGLGLRLGLGLGLGLGLDKPLDIG